MTKTSITTDWTGRVTISYDDRYSGERVTREFSCPVDGGYVRDQDGKQVCERLCSLGSTLWASRAELAAVIRREYRAMRRAEAREANRYL